MVRVYGLKELEKQSGEPRSTIYYYIRRGLLPKPQKTVSGRSLYSEDHLSLLLEIGKLKDAGLSLVEIERSLQHKLARVDQAGVDLASQEHERLHNRILAVAADEFFTKGYRATRISDIIRRVGITITVFYAHFPSKHALLAECVVAVVDWSNEYVEYQRPLIHDSIEELLWALFAQFRVFQLGGAAGAVFEVEGQSKEDSLRRSLEAAHASIVNRITKVVREFTIAGDEAPEIMPEMIAEILFAASDPLFRFSSQRQDRGPLIRANVYVHLSVLLGLSGRPDINAEMKRCEKLVDYMSTHMPPLPPVLELQLKDRADR